jgi:hypothetical protein
MKMYEQLYREIVLMMALVRELPVYEDNRFIRDLDHTLFIASGYLMELGSLDDELRCKDDEDFSWWKNKDYDKQIEMINLDLGRIKERVKMMIDDVNEEDLSEFHLFQGFITHAHVMSGLLRKFANRDGFYKIFIKN